MSGRLRLGAGLRAPFWWPAKGMCERGMGRIPVKAKLLNSTQGSPLLRVEHWNTYMMSCIRYPARLGFLRRLFASECVEAARDAMPLQ